MTKTGTLDDGQSDASMPVAIRNLEEYSTSRRMTSAHVFIFRESLIKYFKAKILSESTACVIFRHRNK
ncbi:MAG: hypothetical protein VB135_01800 [Burkholderia sp.]